MRRYSPWTRASRLRPATPRSSTWWRADLVYLVGRRRRFCLVEHLLEGGEHLEVGLVLRPRAGFLHTDEVIDADDPNDEALAEIVRGRPGVEVAETARTGRRGQDIEVP